MGAFGKGGKGGMGGMGGWGGGWGGIGGWGGGGWGGGGWGGGYGGGFGGGGWGNGFWSPWGAGALGYWGQGRSRNLMYNPYFANSQMTPYSVSSNHCFISNILLRYLMEGHIFKFINSMLPRHGGIHANFKWCYW